MHLLSLSVRSRGVPGIVDVKLYRDAPRPLKRELWWSAFPKHVCTAWTRWFRIPSVCLFEVSWEAEKPAVV